jgi:hypothetical protein
MFVAVPVVAVGAPVNAKLTEHGAGTAPVVYVVPLHAPPPHVPPTMGGVAYPAVAVTVKNVVKPLATTRFAGVTDPPVAVAVTV